MCGRDVEGINVAVLCGLVSGGHKSCSARHHSIYTRVSRFKGWIKNQIEGEAYHKEKVRGLIMPYRCNVLLEIMLPYLR